MSTIASTNIKHPSSATNNITLASTGAVAVNGAMTGAGLDLITPTSIAYSGGSASASGGAVTFTGVTVLSLNGVFTSTYDAYRIVMRLTGTNDAAMSARLRLSGTDAAGSTYEYENFYAASSTLLGARATSQTEVVIGRQNTVMAAHYLEVNGANLAEATTFVNQNAYMGNAYVYLTHGVHTTATAYDGITFFPGAGTVTGKIRVYGYKNS